MIQLNGTERKAILLLRLYWLYLIDLLNFNVYIFLNHLKPDVIDAVFYSIRHASIVIVVCEEKLHLMISDISCSISRLL